MKLSLLAATAFGCINALTEDQVQLLQQDFLRKEGSPYDLFKPENFRYHNHRLFLEVEDINTLIQNEMLTEDQCGGRNPVEELAEMIASKDLYHLLTEEDVAASGPTMCFSYGSKLGKIGDKLGPMSEVCFQYVLEGCSDYHQLKYISPTFVERNVLVFTANIKALDFLSVEQIQIITNVPVACECIENQSLARLTTAEQWKAVNPSCLYSIEDMDKVDLSTALSNGIIPYEQFSYMKSGLNLASTDALTEKHVRYYQVNVIQTTSPLHCSWLKPDACKGLSPEMFKKWFEWVDKENLLVSLEQDSWKNLPKNIFREFASESASLRLVFILCRRSYPNLTAEQLRFFFHYPAVCASLLPGAIFSKEEFKKSKISSTCFNRMSPNLKYHILTFGYSLPDNILEHETSQSIKKLIGGIESLSKIKAKNKRKIIQNVSKRVKDGKRHACRLIKDLAIFKSLRIFREVVPGGCWENLGFTIQSRHVLRAPKLLAGRPKVLKTILQKESNGYVLGKLSPRTMKRMTSGKAANECKYMKYDQFKQLGEELCKALSPKCVASLTFLKDLKSEDYALFGPKAFSYLDNHSAQGINFGDLLNDQLENISNEADFERTVGKLLTNDVLDNQITHKRLNFIPARVWGAVPTDGFCIFRSPEIFARISGEKMVYWTAEQVRMIPSDVLASMNPNQAKRIGHLIGNNKKKDIAVMLKDHSKKMDPIVKSVFAERFATFGLNFTSEAPSFGKSILTSALSMIIAAVVLL